MTVAATPDLTTRLTAKRRAEKKFLDTFIDQHGDRSQRARYRENLLPGLEIKEIMLRVAFAPAASFDEYVPISRADITAVAGDSPAEDRYRSMPCTEVNREQWATLLCLRSALGRASTATARIHEARLDDPKVPWGVVKRYGALAVMKLGPFEVRKEFAL